MSLDCGADFRDTSFLGLRDFRDNKKELLAERGVLTDMHVLNINVATKTESLGSEVIDFFQRQGELITEGFAAEGEQWLGTDAADINWSNRREKDIKFVEKLCEEASINPLWRVDKRFLMSLHLIIATWVFVNHSAVILFLHLNSVKYYLR